MVAVLCNLEFVWGWVPHAEASELNSSTGSEPIPVLGRCLCVWLWVVLVHDLALSVHSYSSTLLWSQCSSPCRLGWTHFVLFT